MNYKQITNFLNSKYPESSAEKWDNVGVIFGNKKQPIKTIVVSLDLSSNVLEQAIKSNADLIINHHPFIFDSESIKEELIKCPYKNRMNRRLENTGMCVYALHTNYDRKDMAKQYASALGFEKFTPLKNSNYAIVINEGMQMNQFVALIKKKLKVKVVLTSNDAKTTGKIAIFPGAGGSPEEYLKAKKQGVKTVLTADIKWSDSLFLKEEGMQAVIISHKAEDVFVKHVANTLSKKFKDIKVIPILEDEIVYHD